jgi:hypothetical protein
MTERIDHNRYDFLTPDDDPSLLDEPIGRVDLPSEVPGPRWWDGLWPQKGIYLLTELETYVDRRLVDMISFGGSPPSLRDIGMSLGAQAAKNAVRWLHRHGHTSPPTLESADLADPLAIENVLYRILQYIRHPAEVAGSSDERAVPVAKDVPPPSENDKEPVGHTRGVKCYDKAYAAYETAMSNEPSLRTDKAVHNWLKKHSEFLEHLESYKLPAFATFTRHLRTYRHLHGLSKHTPRKGRAHGRSVIQRNEID